MLDLLFLKSLNQDAILFFLSFIPIFGDRAMSHLLGLGILLLSLINIPDVLRIIL